MISISNALPVQFWLDGIPTFNEKDEAGIEKNYFNQLFNAEDEIRIQFTDTSLRDYRLTVLDEDDNELTQLLFDSELNGDLYVYSLLFIAEENEILNQCIRFKISYFDNAMSGNIVDYIEEIEGEIEYFGSQSAIFQLGNDTTAVCESGVFTLYFADSSPFGVGVFLFTDIELTIPVTGYDYISDILTGSIFNLNDITGEVGADTGLDCIF